MTTQWVSEGDSGCRIRVLEGLLLRVSYAPYANLGFGSVTSLKTGQKHTLPSVYTSRFISAEDNWKRMQRAAEQVARIVLTSCGKVEK